MTMPTTRRLDQRGMTVAEVLVAMAILAFGLVATLGMLSVGALAVQTGGSQSKATAYARQQMESLRNQPFVPGPASGSDTPETNIARSWTIAAVGATTAPNRLARITVTVQVTPGNATTGFQAVTLETMRAECGGAAPPC